MIYEIENNDLKIEVTKFGSILHSVKSKSTGYEFLWQGNPEIWNGQSPILFPIIGRLLNDKCYIDGKEYSIIRHGICRHNDFELFKKSDSELILLQKDNDETLKSFPYHYEIYISFKIEGKSLTVTHTVRNINNKVMSFSIGAHPAFNCEMGDTVEFEKNETKYCERIDHDSILIDDKDLILNNSNIIKINEHTFDKDAMIFSNLNSEKVTLHKKNTGKDIVFSFGKAPFFAVWAKPNAPFVCLEPWYGINDSYKFVDDFSKKRGNINLPAHEEFSFSWRAEFRE